MRFVSKDTIGEEVMMKKIKVCFFCEKWGSGGIEAFLTNIIRHLDMEAVQADLVTVSLSDSVFTKCIQEKGVRLRELSGNSRNLPHSYSRFIDLLRKEKYDVFYLNAFHGLSLYYVRLARQAGIPIRIAHSHNTALRYSRTRWAKIMIHHISKTLFAEDLTALWACSTPAAEFLFPQKTRAKMGVRLIPNGIETDRFRFRSGRRAEVRRSLGLSNQFLIGNVGRLCSQKNQSFLLDVFAEVIHRVSASRLLLVGDGEMSETLKKQARRLGISDRVIFYGMSGQIELLLWAMDILVLPSRFEGLPVICVEAQAAGLPVICSKAVTEEAGITPLFQSLDLSAGAAKWAEILVKEHHRTIVREDYAEVVQNAGFEAADVAAEMENVWLTSLR